MSFQEPHLRNRKNRVLRLYNPKNAKVRLRPYVGESEANFQLSRCRRSSRIDLRKPIRLNRHGAVFIEPATLPVSIIWGRIHISYPKTSKILNLKYVPLPPFLQESLLIIDLLSRSSFVGPLQGPQYLHLCAKKAPWGFAKQLFLAVNERAIVYGCLSEAIAYANTSFFAAQKGRCCTYFAFLFGFSIILGPFSMNQSFSIP